MSNFNSDEFQKVMIEELDQRTEELSKGLTELEKKPNSQIIRDDILRCLHSIKGLFSLSGYPSISTLAHTMEDLITNGDISKTPKIVDYLYQFNDELERLSVALKSGKKFDILRFDRLTQQLTSIDELMIKLSSNLRIRVIFSPESKMTSARALVLINKLKDIATINQTIPPIEEIEAGINVDELLIELVTQEDEETINKLCSETQDVISVNISRILESITTTTVAKEPGHEPLNVRVNLSDLDSIIQLLGDLVIYGQFLREIAEEQSTFITRSYRENLSSFERTIAEIQDLIIKMRLVPLETVLTRFPRMIRELSKQEGKKVDFIIIGKSYGVDRSIIEQLIDPLTHILRNAVSHGIESPEERIEKGKDPIGIIRLSVSHERSDIIIEIYDDGRGIDFEKVKEKGIKLNILDPNKEISREQLVNLLFHSRFSTATEITEVSGRGVGLLQVKEVMDSIGATIEVDSEKDKFTTFRLIIPLSVAIAKVLLLTVKNYQMAIPMGNIEQIISVPADKIYQKDDNKKTIVVDNVPVPIVDLRERLVFEEETEENKSVTQNKKKNNNEIVVLWKKGNLNLGFIVDELLGERDVVIKPIHQFIQVGAFSSATILEGGKVVLIIDPMNFLEVEINA